MPPCGQRYILVSPVKDEQVHIVKTIKAVLRQTIRPIRWVIVDDGSSDDTLKIARSFASQHSWITVLALGTGGGRRPGSGIIRAFNAGFEIVKDEPFDFIVKFDCDIEFSDNYFEYLLAKFADDERLGIASGVYLEEKHGSWNVIDMPWYHAAGQTKIVRAKCFKDIEGFVESRGWDTLDEIRARAHGWITRHFKEISFHHLKIEGSGIGFSRTSMMHGEIYYLTGGSKRFLCLKVIHRIAFGRPRFTGGLLLFWGYCRASFSGRRRLVSPSEAALYRRLLHQRIYGRLLGDAHVWN